MRPTPNANANISITTAHFRTVARSSRKNADRAETTPPPSAIFAAKALPNTTLAPPRSTANIADGPWIRKTSATSTTAAIWYATARNASRRPAAAEFSTRETRWDGKGEASKGAPPSRRIIAGAEFQRQPPKALSAALHRIPATGNRPEARRKTISVNLPVRAGIPELSPGGPVSPCTVCAQLPRRCSAADLPRSPGPLPGLLLFPEERRTGRRSDSL